MRKSIIYILWFIGTCFSCGDSDLSNQQVIVSDLYDSYDTYIHDLKEIDSLTTLSKSKDYVIDDTLEYVKKAAKSIIEFNYRVLDDKIASQERQFFTIGYAFCDCNKTQCLSVDSRDLIEKYSTIYASNKILALINIERFLNIDGKSAVTGKTFIIQDTVLKRAYFDMRLQKPPYSLLNFRVDTVLQTRLENWYYRNVKNAKNVTEIRSLFDSSNYVIIPCENDSLFQQ